MKCGVIVCAACVAALLVTGLAGCNGNGQAAGGFQMPPPSVTTAPVTVADVPVYLDEIGKTWAYEVVTVIPQVSGKITDRLFTDGADLGKGQKLFLIDPRPFQASLDAANAMLQQAHAQLTNAQTDFTRISSLLATKAVAQQDYDNANNAVAVAVANVKSAEAAVETATLNLDYCTITSPIDGRAGQRLVDAGNVVTANSTQLLVIQNLSQIYVDFTIPENDLDEVRKDYEQHTLHVLVHTPDDPNVTAEGSLTFLDNSVQDGTGTIKLRATLDNKNHWVWPGQFVRVRLILRTLKDALLIPNEAVQIGQQGQFVFVIHEDSSPHKISAEQRNVTVGQRQGEQIVVTGGLSPQDIVVQTGQLAIIPGNPVTIKPATTNPSPAGAVSGVVPSAAAPTSATTLPAGGQR